MANNANDFFTNSNNRPITMYKQILASAENALVSPEEINSHIFSPADFIDGWNSTSWFRDNKLFGAYEYDPLEITLPNLNIKYMHFWSKDSFSKPFPVCAYSIYASIKDNSKITFAKNSDGEYVANIPDGVKLIYGYGVDKAATRYKQRIYYRDSIYEGHMSCPEFPIDISNNTGKIWIQIVNDNLKDNVETSAMKYTHPITHESEIINMGPSTILCNEFAPVFYDHYGVAVSSWSPYTIINSINGQIPFIKL